MKDSKTVAPATGAFDCLACGACCAAFRVSFYWAEIEAYGVAPELTKTLTPVLACMQGTDQARPRCVALEGVVGEAVHCRIHPQRPSPCREVMPGDGQCLKARGRFGLPT